MLGVDNPVPLFITPSTVNPPSGPIAPAPAPGGKERPVRDADADAVSMILEKFVLASCALMSKTLKNRCNSLQ